LNAKPLDRQRTKWTTRHPGSEWAQGQPAPHVNAAPRQVVEKLIAEDDRAERIAAEGYRTMVEDLSFANVIRYWQQVNQFYL
jgi:hypothetical protein